MMKLTFAASNALNKWLKADLPRLPVPEGKTQAGVNTLTSCQREMCWQVHIIDNQYEHKHNYQYQPQEKTLIACEADSRFVLLIPVPAYTRYSLDELTELLILQWQFMVAETLSEYALIRDSDSDSVSHSDIEMLLSKLAELKFDTHWVKNTDLSINGHICDTAAWVEQAIVEQRRQALAPEQAIALATYLNTSVKRVTNKATRRKEKFIPIKRMFAYCQAITGLAQLHSTCKDSNIKYATDNVIDFTAYKRGKLGK